MYILIQKSKHKISTSGRIFFLITIFFVIYTTFHMNRYLLLVRVFFGFLNSGQLFYIRYAQFFFVSHNLSF